MRKEKAKKTKHTDQPQYINFILDESGSMEMIKSSVISGFNEYIQTLKKKAKGDILFTLTKFDSEGIRIPYVAKPIADIEALDSNSYQPNQMTPLYDAVCTTIKQVEKKVKEGQPVLIAIMTDGMENYSKEYGQGQLASMIKTLQNKGWTFVFMGANQDSWATAQKWGIQKNNIQNWEATDVGSRDIMRSFAESTVMYSSVNSAKYQQQAAGQAVNMSTQDFFSQPKEKEQKGQLTGKMNTLHDQKTGLSDQLSSLRDLKNSLDNKA